MGAGIARPCENATHQNIHSKFHVHDLRAPLFRKHSSELVDKKSNFKYCSPRLLEIVMSELKVSRPDSTNLCTDCKTDIVDPFIEDQTKCLMISTH